MKIAIKRGDAAKRRRKLLARSGSIAAAILIAAGGPALALPGACDAIAKLSIPNTTIDAAEPQPAGAYTPADGKPIADLPAFCRAHGVIAPVPGSRIGFELWLPAADWNGKIEMFGNGGYSSKMSFGSLGEQLKRGYATLATDTGHQGDDPDFAAGHPEAIVDLGVHLTDISSISILTIPPGVTTDTDAVRASLIIGVTDISRTSINQDEFARAHHFS
jgi:hypothetical protein